jgi:alpha-glucosidase
MTLKPLLTLSLFILAVGAGAGTARAATGNHRVISPDGRVAVEFRLQADGVPAYAITYRDQPLVLESRLGFEPDFLRGFGVTAASTKEHRGQWNDSLGERRMVPDSYRELDVDLRHESGRLVRVTLRAYDEGAALRYVFPEQPTKEFKFTGERTEFRFPANTHGYEEHGTEGEYRRAKIADMEPWGERPLTLEFADGRFAALAEAANTRFPRMLISRSSTDADTLVTALGGTSSNLAREKEFAQRHDPNITLAAGEASPWRMFVVGDRPGDLLERNYLMLNLNPPSTLTNTSWIKPGKAMRDTTLTTANSKAIIDFAATAGLGYVHLDWKWYGPVEFEAAGETIVRAPNLDVPEIVRYGREKNVGLILYVDRRQLHRDRDKIFRMFEEWGIVGVKIGFVDVGPQQATAWITETIQKAAEHRLMLNIHDGYRSTGLSRTWPHLMTVEGIRGNEHFPTAEHNCTLPFTRYLAGIGDYTVCYYDKRLKTTHAHQLALCVVSFSPLQWIFWYDRPSMYRGEPEVEFFRRVPTVWDDTKVIHGEIGKFATLARRSGDDWFIGTINSSEPRMLKLPLTFLTHGKSYLAHLYVDDDTVGTATKVRVSTQPVDASTVLDQPLRASGGQAIWIESKTAP